MKNNRVMQAVKRHRRLLLPVLLVAVALVLSGCYVEPDRIVDDSNGLTIGTEGQNFDIVITSPPVATPTPKPTEKSQQIDWADWDFGADTATNPPSGVSPTSASGTTGATAGPTAVGATATPTTATTTTDNSVLQSGSTGYAVKQLQQQLKDLGYYTGSVDGSYGSGTTQAVKDFQTANSLTADGIAGQKTQDALFSKYAIAKSDSTSGSSSSGTSTSNTYTNGKTNIYLRLGSTGDQVRILQNRLIYLGYLAGTADGIFAETTEAGVVAFQQRNSLTADGVAGPDTLVKLYSSSANKASSVVSYLGTLRVGMSGDGVRAMQKRLRDLDYYDHSVDGDFGQNTYTSVVEFQTANGLTADGVAGKTTLNKMFSGTATAGGSSSGGSSSSTASDPAVYGETATSTGYKTMSSTNSPPPANVTALQTSLSSLGYYTGSLDGQYGSGTTTAVTNYQASHGLRVTGSAGPAMQRMLYGGTSEGSYSPLRPGDTGSEVRNLQYTLYELKYYDGEITGTYDEITENAVRDFQDVNDLDIDGKAGVQTLGRLYSSAAKALESEYE
ncbi:MAG: peptidoglycan-binding protein [Clostridiales bacterium]|nr:peptidoglycan-binding protein [Clostridiales bacterium]